MLLHPCHLLSHEASSVRLLFEPLPQRVSVGTVHVNLTEHVKLSVVRLSKLLDLSFSAWFLRAETGPGRYGAALSAPREGSFLTWFPNWLEGKARMRKPLSAYLACISAN